MPGAMRERGVAERDVLRPFTLSPARQAAVGVNPAATQPSRLRAVKVSCMTNSMQKRIADERIARSADCASDHPRAPRWARRDPWLNARAASMCAASVNGKRRTARGLQAMVREESRSPCRSIPKAPLPPFRRCFRTTCAPTEGVQLHQAGFARRRLHRQQDRERLQQIGRLFGVDEPLLEDGGRHGGRTPRTSVTATATAVSMHRALPAPRPSAAPGWRTMGPMKPDDFVNSADEQINQDDEHRR